MMSIRPDELSTCISCGLCLNDCPTFRVLGDEADSPRGRIALMRTLVSVRGTPDPSLVEHLEACLVCRACETACPSGVPFGILMEGAREILHERVRPPLLARLALRIGLGTVADPRRLGLATRLVRLYQRLGVRALAHRLGLVPRALRDAEALLPARIDAAYELRDEPAIGEERHHIAFFAGCVMRTAFGATDRATVRVLRKNGCRVLVPRAQVCCGALHAHAGEADGSRALARRNIEAFEASGATIILVNAAGCGAQLKGYGVLLRDDAAWRDRAERFAVRVRDVTEFLAANFVASPRPLRLRVAYQDACHLAHGQKVRRQPRALLAAIPQVTIVELGDGERCCGSAGTYNLTHRDVADELGQMKASAIRNVNPDVVVTANPGCLLQISAHLERAGARIPVRHIMDLLDETI
ncbi:MAG: 4Fe-4S dicluster domain-containing protein [Chloroflexi bacterium]|nr:MAG: 4Fe-4S dicluster domain-containing protein [Chloroflexota bacterium]